MKLKLLFILLMIGFLGSIGLNVALYQFAQSAYRDAQSVRLDPTQERKFDALNQNLSTPKPSTMRIVYFGDSRLEQWKPLPEFPGVQSVNRGSGGETTAQGMLRLERDVIALRPHLVVIQYGVNDLKNIGALADRKVQIVENCGRNLRRMVERSREHGIQVVLTTIFPAGTVELARRPMWSDATYAAIDTVNADLKALAGEGVWVVNCDQALGANGRINPDFALDTLHLNPAGYKALDATLRPVIEDVLSRLQGPATHAVQ